jgi:alpha-L-arabinofuranosidase
MTLGRRTFLASLAALAAPAVGRERTANLTVLVDEKIGRISPLIYSQFAEHIGRLIYGGVWVGADSKTPNRGGYRLDTLRALERVKPPLIRWPGGCFADAYHWEDGIGPLDQRKRRANHWWPRDEPNTFGTDEFLGWCELLKAEPYLSINVGSGSISEALNWLEYCNGSGNTVYAAMRTRNGRQKPYAVRWWGIGNENWGCGGLMTAAEYAQQFRQYAVYLKRLGLTTDLELVGVGHTAPDWNRVFLDSVGAGLPYLDHLSVHRYFRRGNSADFTDADYTDLMLDVSDFENTITAAIRDIEAVEPRRAKMPVFGPLKPKPIGLTIDEWGVWHNDARLADGFRQNGVLREALFAASCLNLFHRYAARITMTNLAQVIDCLQSLILTDDESIVLTPTFHVYELYQPHRGAVALRVDLTDAPTIGRGARSQPSISVSASQSQDTILLTLVNQDQLEDTDAVIRFRGTEPVSATAIALSGSGVRAQNTRENPDAVSPRPWNATIDHATIRVRLPAASVVTMATRSTH